MSIEGIVVQIHRQGKRLNFNLEMENVFLVFFSLHRYNKGQSPLLLRRNLLEYGNHQVAPSPLLPRR